MSALPILPDLPSLETAATTVGKAAGSAASTVASYTLFGGIPLSNVVTIIVGLLLIGAGLFSMQKTRDVIVSTGAKAAKVAAAAA